MRTVGLILYNLLTPRIRVRHFLSRPPNCCLAWLGTLGGSYPKQASCLFIEVCSQPVITANCCWHPSAARQLDEDGLLFAEIWGTPTHDHPCICNKPRPSTSNCRRTWNCTHRVFEDHLLEMRPALVSGRVPDLGLK